MEIFIQEIPNGRIKKIGNKQVKSEITREVRNSGKQMNSQEEKIKTLERGTRKRTASKIPRSKFMSFLCLRIFKINGILTIHVNT